MNEGFKLSVYPIDQRIERYLPADHVFGGTVKLFGLQYKVLYQNQNGKDHWRMSYQQHSMLQKFPWIYYGLSDLKSPHGFRNSLHYLRLCTNKVKLCGSNSSGLKLSFPLKNRYTRWAEFYKELLQCRKGVSITSEKKLKKKLTSYLMPDIEEERPNHVTERINEMADVLADVFVIDVESREALHLSPYLRLGAIEE